MSSDVRSGVGLPLRVLAVMGVAMGSAVWLVSCATPRKPAPAPDLADPIRFHTWEDYYARGRRRLLADRIQAAREDFETCLGVRRGARRSNPEDTWRARTHGMHMFDGYFPNRELGICHYHQDDLTNALVYLRRSMSQIPTGRAAYFLDRVKARRLRHAAVGPPELVFFEPGPIHTRETEFLVRGRAMGPGTIADVRINGQALVLDGARDTVQFAHRVALDVGENRIVVMAMDLKGQQAREEIVVVADWQVPQISAWFEEDETGRRRAQVACVDPGGLEAVLLDERSLPLKAGSCRTQFTVSTKRDAGARFVAMDQAGNEAIVDLRRMLARSRLPTGLSSGSERDLAPSIADAEPWIDLSATGDRFVVHWDRFYLDGEVRSVRGLRRLEVNGSDVLADGDHVAQITRFGSFCNLKEGTNTVSVMAEDGAGRRQSRVLTVVYRPPEYVRRQYRLGASLPPLYASRNPADGYAWQVRILARMLAAPTPRFNLLSLEAEDVIAILAEMQLELMDLVDSRARIDYRQLTPADLLFNGLLVHHREGIELRFHLVDAETGIRHGYVDAYIDDQDPDPGLQVDGLISKIERHYPAVSGRVLAAQGRSARLDAGSRAGVNPWSRLLLVRPGSDGSLDRGTLARAEGRPVELAIVNVRDGESTVRLSGSAGDVRIRPGDYCYTR